MVWTSQHKIPWGSAVIAELVQDFKALAIHHHDVCISEVGHIEESLFWIGRECDSASSITLTITVDERLRDVLAVDREYLDALVGTIRNVYEPTRRKSNANSPSSLVIPVTVTPVLSCNSVRVTPGTRAPLESVTVPYNFAVVT